MSSLIFVTPKRHIFVWFRVFRVITRQNRPCGLVREKIKYVHVYKKSLTLYFIHLPRSPPWTDLHLNWHRGSSRDIMNCGNLFCNRLMGLDSVGGPKFAISHGLSRSPLTQCCGYRAARDVILSEVLVISLNNSSMKRIVPTDGTEENSRCLSISHEHEQPCREIKLCAIWR